jgi:beta-lactamase superfamily II metal-dependent hydrolase
LRGLGQERISHGFWTVDDITFMEPINDHLRDHALLRMVHASEEGPGGIRYLLAHRKCVDIRTLSIDDENPKFTYGSAYFLRNDRLSDCVESINYGRMTARTPVLTTENLHGCAERWPDAEIHLRNELTRTLEETPPFESPGTITEDECERKLPWSVRIYVLKVGQGDTIVLEFPGRRLWIVDAYFWPKLKYDEFRKWLDTKLPGFVVEKAVISHCHYDHIRSMDMVIRDLSPLEVLVADVPSPPPNKTTNYVLNLARQRGKLRVIHQVEDMRVGRLSIRLYPTTGVPGTPALSPDPNEHGLIIAMRTDKAISLLPGDAPGRLLAPLVQDSFFSGVGLERFYKVTHHCSATGDDSALLTHFSANDAVTSCSQMNRYGHPHNPPERRITENTIRAYPWGCHRMTYREAGLIPRPYELR